MSLDQTDCRVNAEPWLVTLRSAVHLLYEITVFFADK